MSEEPKSFAERFAEQERQALEAMEEVSQGVYLMKTSPLFRALLHPDGKLMVYGPDGLEPLRRDDE